MIIRRIKVVRGTKGMERGLIDKIISKVDLNPLPACLLLPLPLEVEGLICKPFKNRYSVQRLIDEIRKQTTDYPVLIITDIDIYYADLDYVFGFTDLERGISIVSLARLKKNASWDKMIERVVKTLSHEVGHLFGLRHCRNRRCAMFLSFGIKDTDYKDKRFCDDCSKRLLEIYWEDGNETRHTC